MHTHTKQSGIGLVEVVVAAAIVSLVVFSLISAYLLYFRAGLDNVARVQGALLAEEGIEILKSFRDDGWTANIVPLSVTTSYYLATTTSAWQATTTSRLIFGKFQRVFQAGAVSRDANGTIVSSGGSVDSGTRKITVTVAWSTTNGTTTRTTSTYLTNLFNN